ncbi:competence protein ComGC [Granulicatella balaenopterae]|uniref:Competence protein ComGC n=1 Tax=Granulicatella balaenopterae TaxID=137733 RepID=A0A1H9L3C5_9LACT|nr:competence type IV pilus major pilin ComGC [Granulicatella balaenopterae]SER05860.1 competence protein ComGC [Granulicatella balaenopterae]
MKKRGFTLVEMLVVLFVIGLLTLLLIPNLSSQREKAIEKTDSAIIRVVEDQYQLYLLNEGGTDSGNVSEVLGDMESKDYITTDQSKAYTEAIDRAKNDGE